MRSPKHHVAKDETESWKVRFRIGGKHTSITFCDEGTDVEFCLILDGHRDNPQRAVNWLAKPEEARSQVS